ncbi:MAG: hypothetical protein WC238_05745 [Parcubacteria group bacterium]|jgi:hypothetical protein
MKPRVLYHGSPKNILGMINPSRAVDINNSHPENNLNAVYASDNRTLAISRAVEKGNFPKDWMNVEKSSRIFLYAVPSETFEQTKSDSSQYVSFVSVFPIRVEVINVPDYLSLREPNCWEHLAAYPKSLLDKMLLGFAASPF